MGEHPEIHIIKESKQMDNNELMVTEMNDFEGYEDTTAVNSDSKFGIGVGVGAAAMLVSGLVYKFVIEPIHAKRKAKKHAKEVLAQEEDLAQEGTNQEDTE
jgi:hypothetical protein